MAKLFGMIYMVIMKRDETHYITGEEAQHLLSVSRQTFWRWRRRKLVRDYFTPTGKLRFVREDVLALIGER